MTRCLCRDATCWDALSGRCGRCGAPYRPPRVELLKLDTYRPPTEAPAVAPPVELPNPCDIAPDALAFITPQLLRAGELYVRTHEHEPPEPMAVVDTYVRVKATEPPARSGHVKWVESCTARTLTPIEAELVDLLCMAFRTGPYNLGRGRTWVKCMDGSIDSAWFYVARDLSTCDGDGLARLVVGAAERCLRLSVLPHGLGRMKLMVWQRSRDGGLSKAAPPIEEVIASVRDWYFGGVT